MPLFAPPEPNSRIVPDVVYDPDPAVTINFSDGDALVDADAVNLAITFTVPANGKVRIIMSGIMVNVAGIATFWGLREGAAAVPRSEVIMGGIYTGGSFTYSRVFTGLTPGEVKTWKWAARPHADSASGTSLKAGTGSGECRMEVRSVP